MSLQKKLIPLLLAASFAGHAGAVDLIAVGTLSGLGSDLSAITAAPLENGIAGNLLGGMGSGLAYAGNNTFVATPDRGPNALSYNALVDDTSSYVARFQTLSLGLTKNAAGAPLAFSLTPVLTATTLLSSPTALVYGTGALGTGNGHVLGSGVPTINDATHNYFSGRSDNFDPTKSSANPANARLDPEAVRVAPDGKSVYVSDEYGPYIYQFDRASGQRIRSFALPANLAVSHLSAQGATEIAGNTVGRVANKGMEGLAISADGKTLVGIMQAPLEQDASKMLRIVTIDVASGATKEFAYKLSNGSGVSDIVALNDHQFLVDERDGKGLGDGSNAAVKQGFVIDIAGGVDVSGVSRLSASTPALSKTMLIDIVPILQAHGYTAAQIPAKIEGFAFGADVTLGGVLTHTLYVANDNDFSPGTSGDNQFFVFGVTDADLARVGVSYLPQTVAAVPETSNYAMLLAGLGMLGLTAQRKRQERFRDEE